MLTRHASVPLPSLLLVAARYPIAAARPEVERLLPMLFGDILAESVRDHSGLWLYPFARPVDPVELTTAAGRLARIEGHLRADSAAQHAELRAGLVQTGHLLLAHPEAAPQRVPMESGHHVEVHLWQPHGQWQPLPWTAPELATPAAAAHLDELLLYLRTHHETAPLPHQWRAAIAGIVPED